MSASKEQRLASKVSQLEKKLASLEVRESSSQKPKRRRRRAANAQAFGPSNLNRDNVVLPITRVELLRSISIADKQSSTAYAIEFKPTNSILPWLNKLWSAFGQARWLHLELFWKPSVSATTNGRIIMAFDGDGRINVPSKESILAYSPVYDTVIWQDTQSKPLVVPKAMLKPNFLYSTDASGNLGLSSPGSIVIYATGPANIELGEVWVKYKVKLLNPR